jgi:hypothetical protein
MRSQRTTIKPAPVSPLIGGEAGPKTRSADSSGVTSAPPEGSRLPQTAAGGMRLPSLKHLFSPSPVPGTARSQPLQPAQSASSQAKSALSRSVASVFDMLLNPEATPESMATVLKGARVAGLEILRV